MLKWRMADADPASAKLARLWRAARWLLPAGVLIAVLASAALLLWPTERADAQDTWNVRVEIYTSFRDIDGDGDNDYNPQFEVTFTRSAGAAAMCPSPIVLSPRIGSPGTEGSNGNQIIAGATHPTAVAGDCEYTVEWLTNLEDEDRRILTGVEGGDGRGQVDLSRLGADNRVSASHPVAEATFRDRSLEGPGRVNFGSSFSAADAGTMFEVRYEATSASAPACRLPTERDSEVYTIDASGVPMVTSTERRAWAGGSNLGMLLSQPAHRAPGETCRYTLVLPDIEGYTKQAVAPTVTSTGSATVSYQAEGATTFEPSLAFTVPEVDVDGTAGRDFVGATFRVTYARSGGPDTGCTPSSASYIWTLDASGVVLPPASNDVVDVPAGVDPPMSCEYTVNFPSGASVGYGHPDVTDGTISAADNASAATYESRATRFDATFMITGPALVEEADGDMTVMVSPARRRTASWSYMRQATADDGCSASTAVRLSAEFGTNVVSESVTETGIVDLPRGYTTVADRCVYDVTWDPMVPANLSLDADSFPQRELGIVLADAPAPSATFSGGMPTPSATYQLAATPFEPNINIVVPDVNADGTSNSLFAGTTFAVSYAKVATAHEDCSPDGTQNYVVRNNGTVSPDVQAGETFELVDVPRGETVSCVYRFSFPPSAASASGVPVTWELTRRGNEAANVNVDTPRTRQYLPSADIMFAPRITLAVPGVDIDGTAGNDFAGAASSIGLSVARASGPTSGCSSGSHDYVISDAGVAAPAAPNLRFVSVPADASTECVYTVTFSPNNQGGLLVRKTESTDDDTLSGSDAAAMATYETAERPFTATFTATAPAAADGETLELTVTRATGSHTNCLDMFDATVTIGADGSGRVTRANIADWPRGYTVAADRCSYDVAWPYAEAVTGGALATLRRTTETATVSGPAGMNSAAATYVTNVFQPSVTIDAPVVDVDGTAGNDLADQQFAVTIAKTGQPATCSDGGPVTYVIAEDGTVSPSATTPVPMLIDIPEGETGSCVYTVEFPANDNAGDLVRKTESTDDTMSQLSDPAAMATYQTVATSFTLTVNVTAPTSGATKQVTVGITPVVGSLETCEGLASPQTLTFDAAGMALSTHTLVDWPLGFTLAEHRCQYTVDWSTTEIVAPGTGPSLAISQGDSTLVVGRGVATATGTYLDRTIFEADITITVPPVNADGVDTSLFEGTAFEVVFTKKASLAPALNCSEEFRLDYVVDGMGNVAPAVTPVLTDVPGGASDNCEYTVTFPPSATSAQGAAVSWELAAQDTSDGEVRAGSATLTRAYALTSPVTFTPDVTIVVPQIEAGPSNNAFAGASFVVTFTRSDGPATGCETDTGTYAVGADGTVSGTPPTLVNVPADGTDPCVYDIEFPDPVTSTGGALNLASFSPMSVRASANAVSADYQTEFTPAVTIGVPQYDRDGAAGTNYYEGAIFALGFEPVAGANAGCALAASVATVNYVVGANGTVEPAPAAPSLPDVLAGLTAADRCAYTLTFPDPVMSAQGATPAWTLDIDGATTDDVSATRRAVTRGYTAPLSNFSPNVVINVPFVDTDGDDANDLSGLTVTVSYTLAETDPPQDASCTSTPTALTETYTISATRRAAPDDMLAQVAVGTALTLVDRPAGQDVRCVYDVDVTPDAELDAAMPVSSVSVKQIDGGTPVVASYSAQRKRLPLLIAPAGIAARERTVVIVEPRPDGEDVAGFVPTEDEVVPIVASLSLPEFEFAADAAIEVLLNSPGVCGADMDAFGGVPASIGLAYAVAAQSDETVPVVGPDTHMLAAFAERGDEQRPCVLRVTVLAAPQGCTLEGASTDDEGRSYVDLSWSEGLETFTVNPTIVCG